MIMPGGYPRSVRQVQGLRIEMIDINRLIKDIKGVSLEGLVRAAALIRTDTETVSPATPVDLGNLRASWFTVSIKGSQPDPLGLSGTFKNRPFKKMQIKASEMKAYHARLIAAAQAKLAGIKDPAVVIGYSANYAMWVHEMVGVKWSERSPAAGSKWFESAIKRNKDRIVQTVAKHAHIP